ncbi:hypothetical protein [Kibdelosporangium philippinense]|uniref:hypothetical protein n=1 Tax=Kibdelosporangium philippinense TaxID=211113 RepID=UPI003612C439
MTTHPRFVSIRLLRRTRRSAGSVGVQDKYGENFKVEERSSWLEIVTTVDAVFFYAMDRFEVSLPEVEYVAHMLASPATWPSTTSWTPIG